MTQTKRSYSWCSISLPKEYTVSLPRFEPFVSSTQRRLISSRLSHTSGRHGPRLPVATFARYLPIDSHSAHDVVPHSIRTCLPATCLLIVLTFQTAAMCLSTMLRSVSSCNGLDNAAGCVLRCIMHCSSRRQNVYDAQSVHMERLALVSIILHRVW
jgi:hypothetical protein